MASSLWPASIVGAILAQSPTLQDIYNPNHETNSESDSDANAPIHILELGAGLGLQGLAAAQGSSTARCSVVLTDNDRVIVGKLQDMLEDKNGGVTAEYLDWRDEDCAKDKAYDVILGSALAYYYFLLRPLMDTIVANLKPTKSLLMVCGQANRDSQWELYRNIRDGCYNQLTDTHDKPWPGDCKMLLYRLEMGHWEEDEQQAATVDGTVPMAILCYENPDMKVPPLSNHDYIATEADFEGLILSF